MTLDEAIEREEALAYSFGERYKRGGEPVGELDKLEAEHKQMAEWLKELKESRIVLDILGQFLVDRDIDVCCEDLTMEDDYCEKFCDNQKPLCWYRWAKMKAREVNADEDSY